MIKNLNNTIMKNYLIVGLAMIFGLASCTSGQNSPVDSHPSSSSVKAGRDKKTDTVKKEKVKSDNHE